MGNGIINRYKSNNNNNNNNNNNTITRTSKICIPYDKWIQNDCKKWGHYKEFNLTTTPTTTIISPLFSTIDKINENQIYYVNGHFFKPLERLGSTQFIITELNKTDIIVTIPTNIERYRNDTLSKEMNKRLNRVIGICDRYLIFQIWKGNSEIEIFIYDYFNDKKNLTSNRIVRKLNRRFNSRTYTCVLSPDKNYLLITPDYEDNHSYLQQIHSEITLIININTFKIIRFTSARCDQRFAFHPRIHANNNIRLAEFDTVRGQITDILNEKVIVCSNHTLKTKVYRVEYTKDGYLIIVICTLPIFQRCKRDYFIYVLNSVSLLHMRSIIDYRGPLLTTYTFTNEFYLLFNMYPSLSNCGTNIAILKNIEPYNNLRFIELYSLPNSCCIMLKEICRKVILRIVDSKNISRLPLPDKLISYLAFNIR
jgi:hypothetical protein